MKKYQRNTLTVARLFNVDGMNLVYLQTDSSVTLQFQGIALAWLYGIWLTCA